MKMNLLGFFDRFSHGEEDAIEQYCSHDEIVEELVRAQEDARLPVAAPRAEQEERAGRREAMDVVLAKALRHHAKCLQPTLHN